MSRMLLLLNRLKAEARRDILTDTQLAVLNEIDKLWHFPRHVNLAGPTGAGKTMVGWVIARSMGASIYSSPRVFDQRFQYGESRVVIDNVPSDQQTFRAVLTETQLKDVYNALFITAQPNQLGLPVVTLTLPTAEDIDVIYRNLSLLEHYPRQPLQQGDCWAIIHSVL